MSRTPRAPEASDHRGCRSGCAQYSNNAVKTNPAQPATKLEPGEPPKTFGYVSLVIPFTKWGGIRAHRSGEQAEQDGLQHACSFSVQRAGGGRQPRAVAAVVGRDTRRLLVRDLLAHPHRPSSRPLASAVGGAHQHGFTLVAPVRVDHSIGLARGGTPAIGGITQQGKGREQRSRG